MVVKMNRDCFAYRRSRCTLLYYPDCSDCVFYKTKKQYSEDIVKSKLHLDERLGFAASEMEYEELQKYLKKRKEEKNHD